MVEGKKSNIKLTLLLICLVIYTTTSMYNKINMIILITLAVIVGVAIHYINEFIFNQIEKYKKKWFYKGDTLNDYFMYYINHYMVDYKHVLLCYIFKEQ
jgi:membrane protein YdbS with pleckstrin-like domain